MKAHRARKRFGQNFLTDEAIIDAIIKALAPQPKQHLVEIGPGQGALTKHVLPLCDQLDLIELDNDLIPLLDAFKTTYPFVKIYHQDILKLDFAQIAQGDDLRIYGNLPYNISSPILFHCLDAIDLISDMLFMLQKEVVDRIAAAPGTKTYGRLSVMVQFYCEVTALFDVPHTAFTPQPKVESAIIYLKPKPVAKRQIKNMTLFNDIVRAAFSQRRKMLRQSLKAYCHADRLSAVGIEPTARAENIPADMFVKLADHLAE